MPFWKKKASPDPKWQGPFRNPQTGGVRACAVCGKRWISSSGMVKEMFGPFTSVGGTYSPENLAGLTCTSCGKSFCKSHLNQDIPSYLPGGECPSCGERLDVS